ncbi:MAG: site-specific DNA-methyltransferase [Proteobacteria bacterium]|nr:site-specific DNA-methyltransferase [Pseudomonadota bacterium]
MTLSFAPESIELWPLDRLRPYVGNAKTHGADQVARIAGSMAEFGWTVPVLVSAEGEVIAGHGRILAAAQLGLAEAPVIVLDHLSEAQRRAYRIADNKLTELGDWDDALLSEELQALASEAFDLSLIGFDDTELDRLLAGVTDDTDARGGEDEIPEAPEEPVSRPGDLWILGNHRLLCGDATIATDVERVLGSVKPLLMVTDPPYGVDYDPAWRNKVGAAATRRTGKVLNDDRADWREAWALFPGDVAYVWHGALHASTVIESLAAVDFETRAQIIWAKDRLVLSRGDYHWQHEPCNYSVRKSRKGHWAGDRKQTTLWHIANRDQDAETVHGTQKPVECMRRPIVNNSSPGQAVYDPFMGSGTTLIAAETTGRVCHGIELNPVYVDVAVERWQKFTGEVAVLDGEKHCFDNLLAEGVSAR